MARLSWEERREAAEAKKAKAKQGRASMRSYWGARSKALHRRLINIIKDGTAGVDQSKIALCSGADPSTVSNFMHGKTDSLRLSTFVAIAAACGFNVVLEKMPSDQDMLYDQRRVKLPPREKDAKAVSEG